MLATSSCMTFGEFHGVHSPKTTMTMEKHNHLKMYLLITGENFSIEMLDFGDVLITPRLETP